MIALDQWAIDRFRTVVADRLGLHFDEGKQDLLSGVLRERIQAHGGQTALYLRMLGSAPREELRVLASSLTVSETYFFRNPEQFRALAEVALPQRMSAKTSRRKFRVLSAGCASGEEAFSIAITLRDHLSDLDQSEVSILGVDINPAVIEKARRAHYSSWSLRGTSEEIRHRYFRRGAGVFVLNEPICKMASFEERNLAEEDATFWNGQQFDVIFCRNFIMYLVPAAMQHVVESLTSALVPGGFLFLGHAESLRGLSDKFHLRHTHHTFYYQKRDQWEASPAAAASVLNQPTFRDREIAWPDESWVDVIRTASQRIQNLARDCDKQPDFGITSHPAFCSNDVPRDPRVNLGLALELLRQEKFREALTALGDLGQGPNPDADAQLLRAVLLTNCGDIAAAEAICANVLAQNDLNAGAHYVMALCREYSGDCNGAMEQDRMAVHLDPGFAIAYLHLGILARRSRDMTAARVGLQQALVLLLREDASRILLFGGGFSREALVEFTRAQLRACGTQ